MITAAREEHPALSVQGLCALLSVSRSWYYERHLAHIDFLEESIQQVLAEIERCLVPFQEAVQLLQTIPGMGGNRGRGDHC